MTIGRRLVRVIHSMALAAIVTGCGGGGGGTASGVVLPSSGGLDPSFGTGGKVVLAESMSSDALKAVAVGDGGYVYLAGSTAPSPVPPFLAHFLVVKLDGAGNPVGTFGTGGRAVIEIDSGGEDRASALVLDEGGNIYVAGSTTSSAGTIGSTRFAVAKLDANGNPDPGFGTNGKVVVGIIDGNDEFATALVRERSGNLYVTGYSRGFDPDRAAFAAVKLDGSGRLVQSFGAGGTRIVEFDGGWAYGRAASVDSGGNLYIVGGSSASSGFAIAKLDGSGNLVDSFGNGGRLAVLPGLAGGASAVAADRNDEVFVAMTSQPAGVGNGTAALVKLDANGRPASGFGDGGVRFNVFGLDGLSEASALALDGAGNIYVAGHVPGPGTAPSVSCPDFALAKLDFRGNPVTSFGNNGTTTVDVGNASLDVANSVALDGSGRLYVGGSTLPACPQRKPEIAPFVVMRLGQ